MRRYRSALVVTGLAMGAFASPGSLLGGEAADSGPTPRAAAPKRAKVLRKPFKIELSVKGIFEASKAAEVSVEPKEWAQLKLTEAAPAGAAVAKGDTVLSFDTRMIDQGIRDLEDGLKQSGIALDLAKEELKVLRQSLPLDLAAAEREAKHADENLLRFLKVDRPLSEKRAEWSVKSAKNSLEYQLEELRQLEKMYKADDLTEETEEIILKRQRNAVASARFSLERVEIGRERTLTIELPREQEALRESARRETFERDKARKSLPAELKQKELEIQKLELKEARDQQKLARLREDKKGMTVLAPIDGIVYYGECTRGVWPDGTVAAKKLRRGGAVTAGDVVMTVVDPDSLFVRGTLPEASLHLAADGVRGVAVPVGFPDRKLPARLRQVSAIPISAGNFDAILAVEVDDRGRLVPGMRCEVDLTVYEKKNALVIPASALVDGDNVLVWAEGRDPEKRAVKVGRRHGGSVEILDGLKVGEEVVLTSAAPSDS